MSRVFVPAYQAIQAGGIVSSESIPGLLKSLKISSLVSVQGELVKILQF
jgi:hypothetical protein